MRLDDLDVEVGTEGGGGELHEFQLEIDAKRHIPRLKDWDLIGSGAD